MENKQIFFVGQKVSYKWETPMRTYTVVDVVFDGYDYLYKIDDDTEIYRHDNDFLSVSQE